MPKMEKKSLVTLLDQGTIKIETIYKIEPGVNTFITSEAIRSSEKIRNITARINGREISQENYQEYSVRLRINGEEIPEESFLRNKPYRYIGLKQSLDVYVNINEANEVYIKYETKLSTGYQIFLDLSEQCQRTNPQVTVDYVLIVQSLDDDYRPMVTGDQDVFSVDHYIEGFTILRRTYKSFDMLKEKKAMRIENLFFFNVGSRPLQESTRTFKVVDCNLVKEIYNYKMRGVKEYTKRIFQYPVSEYVELTKHPKIKIKVDGVEFTPILIEYDELKKILKTKELAQPFYYLGKGVNSNENTLYIGYILKEGSVGEIDIETEYNANKVLTTQDRFNYVFETDLTIPGHISKIIEFLSFEIPDEFNIDNTNHKSNLITTSFRHSNNLRFKFKAISDYKGGPLRIEFSRKETRFFNIIKIVNICLLFVIVNLLMLWFFRIIPFKISYMGLIFPIIALICGSLVGKFSSANFFQAVTYTHSWIPIILGILGCVALPLYKIIK